MSSNPGAPRDPAALPAEPAEVAWSANLRALAAQHGERCAVRTPQGTLTYTRLSRFAHALAHELRARGVAPGEPVAWSFPNSDESVWASLGIALTGAADTPMHHGLTADEISWFAGLAGVRRVVTRESRRAFFEALGFEVIAVESIDLRADDGDTWPAVPGHARGRILSTSGTTGRPKAVVYTHARRWLGHELLKSALPFSPQAGEAVLLMTPYPHGSSLLAQAWLDHGGEVVLQDGVQREAVEPVLRAGVAAVFAPPTVINKLAEFFPDERFDGVRCLFTGTQTLTEAGYRRAERLFGPVVRVTYGKTECTNPITVLAPQETAAVYAQELRTDGVCLGAPAAGVEIEIRGESGEAPARDGTGEIHLRARHMANGTIDANGFREFEGSWHATGDVGWLDAQGRLWLAGRLSDVIKSGGYKVQPEEIEAVVAGLPGCGQIVITALASDYWGEVIVGVAENVTPGWEAAARERVGALSKHKQPRLWVALDTLPRNPQGKVSRRAVAAAVMARYALIDGPQPKLAARAP